MPEKSLYDQMEDRIRKCVALTMSIEDAKAALEQKDVRVISIHTTSPVASASSLQLKNGALVHLEAEAFIEEDYISDAGASGPIAAGWKKFKF